MHSNSKSESYAAAGVDITAGYKAVELMKKHIARTVCRRAERSMVALQDQTSVEYLNVLSKYLFHLALFLNQVEGVDEIIL